MANITMVVQDVTRNGLDLRGAETTVVPANTYYFPNDGRVKLYVRNSTASPCVVTIETPGTVDGLAITDRTVSIATAKEYEIGPFPVGYYNNDSGQVKCTFDQAVGIVAVRG